jgi:hypothetical protein
VQPPVVSHMPALKSNSEKMRAQKLRKAKPDKYELSNVNCNSES